MDVKQAILLILVLVLIALLVFSRGYRTARRVSLPRAETEKPTEDQSLNQKVSVDATNQDQHKNGEIMPEDHQYTVYVSREELLGHIDPASDDHFVLIDPAYANRSGMYLRREAYEAFLKMREAALEDGVALRVLSATRDFAHQRRIWENKWHGRQVLYGNIVATDIDDPVERAREILRFSAMPGTSRHHWGTDVDLNSLVNSYFESGEGKRIYDWLQANADDYGFCQPYTRHGEARIGGYEEEKWHWSYLPLSSQFLEAYKEMITYEDITGFAGSEVAVKLDVITHYVIDINQACQ